MIKKIAAVLLVCSFAVSAFAQDLVKYNYKRNGIAYIGSERVAVASQPALNLKLVKNTFQDGVAIYTLRIEFEDSYPWKMPKNASMIFSLANGKDVISENVSDAPNLVAPEGVLKNGNKVYYNYGEYRFDQTDLDKLLSGVTSFDATRRRSANGHIVINFKKNEFSAALNKAYDAISRAKVAKEELAAHLTSLYDFSGNRNVRTDTVAVNDRSKLSLSYLYSAESNSESYDLELHVDGVAVPDGGTITVTASSGEVIRLHQEGEREAGEVVCFPETEQIKRMMNGINSISFETAAGVVALDYQPEVFGSALSVLYNNIQRAAIL